MSIPYEPEPQWRERQEKWTRSMPHEFLVRADPTIAHRLVHDGRPGYKPFAAAKYRWTGHGWVQYAPLVVYDGMSGSYTRQFFRLTPPEMP